MFPHEHFVVALVPALAYVLLRDGRPPTLRFVGVVFFGSQFPDLIDKPLAYEFGVIPSGRVFMHSLPVAIPFLLLVGLYGWKTDRIRLSSAFVFAYLAHIPGDHRALLSTNPQVPPELLWPLIPRTWVATPHWAGPGGIYVHLWSTISIVVLTGSVLVLTSTEKDRIGTYWGHLTWTTYNLYRSYRSPQ